MAALPFGALGEGIMRSRSCAPPRRFDAEAPNCGDGVAYAGTPANKLNGTHWINRFDEKKPRARSAERVSVSSDPVTHRNAADTPRRGRKMVLDDANGFSTFSGAAGKPVEFRASPGIGPIVRDDEPTQDAATPRGSEPRAGARKYSKAEHAPSEASRSQNSVRTHAQATKALGKYAAKTDTPLCAPFNVLVHGGDADDPKPMKAYSKQRNRSDRVKDLLACDGDPVMPMQVPASKRNCSDGIKYLLNSQWPEDGAGSSCMTAASRSQCSRADLKSECGAAPSSRALVEHVPLTPRTLRMLSESVAATSDTASRADTRGEDTLGASPRSSRLASEASRSQPSKGRSGGALSTAEGGRGSGNRIPEPQTPPLSARGEQHSELHADHPRQRQQKPRQQECPQLRHLQEQPRTRQQQQQRRPSHQERPQQRQQSQPQSECEPAPQQPREQRPRQQHQRRHADSYTSSVLKSSEAESTRSGRPKSKTLSSRASCVSESTVCSSSRGGSALSQSVHGPPSQRIAPNAFSFDGYSFPGVA
mmetsp:Transcript_33484/g.92521  ORF Transcript_33484/g.92521 Transcript_33484/m.92521 type:complete len:534 (+) Transcript_33484:101-1702(+)